MGAQTGMYVPVVIKCSYILNSSMTNGSPLYHRVEDVKMIEAV